MVLEHLVFKTTGIMTKRCLLSSSKAVGKKVCDKMAQKQGKIDYSEVKQILAETIGKKAASKITISGDKDSFMHAACKILKLPKSQAETIYTQCLSATIPISGSTSLCNLRITDEAPSTIANLTAHELEHAMYQTSSFTSLIAKLKYKIPFFRHHHEKLKTKTPLLNQKNQEFQNFLLNAFGLGSIYTAAIKNNFSYLLNRAEPASRQKLREKIREILFDKEILSLNNEQDNAIILKMLKRILKDEKRAYKAGAFAENYWLSLQEKKSPDFLNISEFRAILYGEAQRVCKQELWYNSLNKLKKFFGLSVKYTREQKIIDNANPW